MISNYKKLEHYKCVEIVNDKERKDKLIKKANKKKKKKYKNIVELKRQKYNKRNKKKIKKSKSRNNPNINNVINNMIICKSKKDCYTDDYIVYDIEPSKGEEFTSNKLKYHNIKFEREVAFDDFITSTGSHRRFDFYIPHMNLIIEYDGKRHEEDDYAKYVDALKNDFCLQKGFNFIRVNRNNYKYLYKAIKKIKNYYFPRK